MTRFKARLDPDGTEHMWRIHFETIDIPWPKVSIGMGMTIHSWRITYPIWTGYRQRWTSPTSRRVEGFRRVQGPEADWDAMAFQRIDTTDTPDLWPWAILN